MLLILYQHLLWHLFSYHRDLDTLNITLYVSYLRQFGDIIYYMSATCDIEMIFTLYAVLEFNSANSLKIICPRVDMSVHSDTLSLIRANQSLVLVLNAACHLKMNNHLIKLHGWSLTVGILSRQSNKIRLLRINLFFYSK
jgi:hypothetical protein